MLIVHGRYWNDADWLDASLQHVDLWEADKVFLTEGCWDKRFPGPSRDATRKMLEAYAGKRQNVRVCSNVRGGAYRDNQAATSQWVMEAARAGPYDWMVTVDVDHFYTADAIAQVKECMKARPHVDFWYSPVMAFLSNARLCQHVTARFANFLPYRFLPGCHWIPTCHLAVGGVQYEHSDEITGDCVPNVVAYHYEGLRSSQRLAEKYGVADRKTPAQAGRTNDLQPFVGEHPNYVLPTLKKLCYL